MNCPNAIELKHIWLFCYCLCQGNYHRFVARIHLELTLLSTVFSQMPGTTQRQSFACLLWQVEVIARNGALACPHLTLALQVRESLPVALNETKPNCPYSPLQRENNNLFLSIVCHSNKQYVFKIVQLSLSSINTNNELNAGFIPKRLHKRLTSKTAKVSHSKGI